MMTTKRQHNGGLRKRGPRLVVQRDAAVTRLTEGTESERLMISQGAEHNAAGLGGHDPKVTMS